ncbi:asparagine synthase (glutamine-hydrolyzing) [Candidatus Omnitrophota bacterium]
MCGICGTVGFVDRKLLERMTAVLTHRGPDADGFYIDDNAGLGVRRLRIIDLATGDQPIYNEDRSLCIVQNGEIYNYQELRAKLRAHGHRFTTQSDTEVILHLYEQYGRECLKQLEGMFAFAIWNTKNKELFIARDRLGIKPLYYHYQAGRLRFASELKAIIQDRSLAREVNPRALSYFFSFLYVPAPLTIFNGIFKLPPAHSLWFKNGDLKIEQYWKLSFPENRAKSFREPEYLERTLELLQAAVKKRLISDVPLGAFLSGGIDSSAVVAMMRQASSGTIKTFSIGYAQKDDASYNELDYAKIVADRFATEHKTFIVEPKVIEILPKVIWHLDEPFADSSAILNFLISREARREVTVALSGTGGDEGFGGYPRYLGARLSEAYQQLPYFLRQGFKNTAGLIPESRASRNVGGWIKRFLRSGLLSAPDRYINWVSFFNPQMQKCLFSQAVQDQLQDFDARSLFRRNFAAAGVDSYLDQIFYLDLNTYLVDDLLFLGDRMSLASSLELRVPFCDYKLIEFSAQIPYSLKIRGLKIKSFLKKSLTGILPAEILTRRKQGFMVPLGDWLRRDLKSFTQEVLSTAAIKSRGYLDPEYVQSIIDAHFSGKRVYTHQIWALLCFELWARSYLDD